MITRRAFLQYSLVGTGLLLLPSIPFVARAEEPRRKSRHVAPPQWLHGDARTGCGRYAGSTLDHPIGLV